MKKLFYTILTVLAGASLVSCQEFLSTNSPSTVDADFVFSSDITASTVMLGAYNTVSGSYTSGLPTNLDDIGSDTERCSVGIIAPLVGAAQLYGGQESYYVENYNIDDSSVPGGNWNTFYSCINKCNQVIANIKSMSNYEQIIASAPNTVSDLLGQAYCLRATMYFELVMHWGDCIYYSEDELGLDVKDLTSRDAIIEKELKAVEAVEKLMFAMNENNHLPDQMTRNYADGLIGRLCFMLAGYQTRRTDLGDDFYVDAEGKPITYEEWGRDPQRNAVYNRRSDWKKWYTEAIPYLEKGVNNSAGVKLTTVDPRSDKEGRVYNNPFQYYFQQVNNCIMADETVFEFSLKAEGGNSRIAYNFGRGSNGGSPAYPPKANAQTCSYPAVLYGVFDPEDLRRDVSVNVTGSTGSGAEILYTYALSNKVTLGVGMNKYDLNRVPNPDARQLYSGMSYIYMRQADIILMLAEAYAVNGETAKAQAELRKIHDRAFPAAVRDAKFNALLASVGGDIYEAVIEERKLEFVGETIRRWDLIRTGKLPKVAYEFRKQLVDQMAELKANGYVQFANGNQYPAYVWTKMVNAKEVLGYRLTMQTPPGLVEGTDEYGLLVPGWRGQHDDWAAVAVDDGKSASIIVQDLTNVAIQGLFRYIDPASAEAATLEANGYKKTAWGANSYATPAYEAQWSSEFMCGYSDADYAAKKAPIYLIPMRETVLTTTGLTNGYGFRNAK